MRTVLVVIVILATVITIASGVWVATGLISAMISFKDRQRDLEDAEPGDRS